MSGSPRRDLIWHVDSGAGMSITGNRSLFSQFTEHPNAPTVKFGNGVIQQAIGWGTVCLCSDELDMPITLDHVLYIPGCPVNLLSVQSVAHTSDCTVSFSSTACTAVRGSTILWSIPATEQGVYTFTSEKCTDTLSCPPVLPALSLDMSDSGGVILPSTQAWLWHRRLGHPGLSSYQHLVSNGMLKNLPVTSDQVKKMKGIPCDACNRAKAQKLPFPQVSLRPVYAPLAELHLDLMGPFESRGIRGEWYILCLVDKFSGFAAVVPLRRKSESALVVQTIIIQWLTILTGCQIKILRSDRAREFLVQWFEDWLVEMGIVHELSESYTAEQNGTVERYNGIVSGIARSIHIESQLPKFLWPYAWLCGCYLSNRRPTKGQKTPFELFFGHKPDVSLLRVFGSVCYVTLNNGKKRNKLGVRSVAGQFLGYSLVSKGYFIYVPELRTVVESRDVVFYEQLDHNCVPGQVPYDGSPYISATNPIITGDVADDLGNSPQHSPPLAAEVSTGSKMVLRPRPGVPHAVPSVVEFSDDTTLELESEVPPLSLAALEEARLNRPLAGVGLSRATSVLPDETLNDGHPESVLSHLYCPPVQNFQVHDSASLQPTSDLQPSEALHRRGDWSPATSLSELSELDPTGLDGPGWGIPTFPRQATASKPRAAVAPAPVFFDGSRTRSRAVAETLVADTFFVPPLSVFPPSAPSSGAPVSQFISTPCNLTYKVAVALDNPDREHWLVAMKDEMSSLTAHGTWLLTHPVPSKKVLTARWIFTKKLSPTGKVERYKARFVAKGFMQRPGLEFSDVFAPVTSKATLRVLLATVVHRKMFCRQLDIQTAFLNGVLDDDIDLYCQQPEGFCTVGPNGVPLVCKLVKSLYGLKQAPRQWSKLVKKVLTAHGYWMSPSDPALFVKKVVLPSGEVLWNYVDTYVDDFFVAIDDLAFYTDLVEAMVAAGWKVKEMGVPKVFLALNMDITLDSSGRCTNIVVSQHTYIAEVVETFGMTSAAKSRSSVPLLKETFTGGKLLPNNTQYLSLIGSLIYLSTCTRPDIVYAVSFLARYSAAPTVSLWEAAKRVLLYLREHASMGIQYSHSPEFTYTVHSDSSFAQDPEDRRSQTGLAVLASGGLVSWLSKRQPTVAVSTSDAEYQALNQAAREVQWLKQLREDLGLPYSIVTIHGDSQGALSWATDWKLAPRNKHIDVMHHYVKELVEDDRIRVAYVNTKDNLADPFTKPLDALLFWQFVGRHGMVKHG